MTKIYPYTYPLILNDEIFSEYGGKEGSSTPSRRLAAYQIAEQEMTSYIDTFLLPTKVTETKDYHYGNQFLVTDYGYVSELLWVKVLDHNNVVLKQFSGTWSWAAIHEDTFGYLYVQDCLCYCGWNEYGYDYLNQPYKFEVYYEAGLPTGTANQPAMLLALVEAAQLILNEMETIPANESTGDVGITEFTSLEYSEKRKMWKNTVFGSSPKSSWIAKLVDGTIKKARRSVMLGRL